MDLELAGKRALVTGGSRGIGKAIARELAREGAAVATAPRRSATTATRTWPTPPCWPRWPAGTVADRYVVLPVNWPRGRPPGPPGI